MLNLITDRWIPVITASGRRRIISPLEMSDLDVLRPDWPRADLDIAYVTSMARPINGVYPREREAGAVFAVHGLGVRGVPEPRFAG